MGKLTNSLGQTIELRSTGYQFENAVDLWDSNWTNVEISVSDGGVTWQTTDPFLSTSDWSEIALWFGVISQHQVPKWREMGFIEPNIEFELVDPTFSSGEIDIRIRLQQECVPPFRGDVEYVEYDFRLTPDDCSRLSTEFQQEYEKFPRR